MGEKNPKILCFGGVIGAGADAVQPASGAPMYYLKEDPKCEIVTEPVAEPFTLDVPVRSNGFTLTGTGTVTMDEDAMSNIARQLHKADCQVTIVPNDNNLPRKMKKALRRTFRRDTRWKRKAIRWRQKYQVSFLGCIYENEDGITISGRKEAAV